MTNPTTGADAPPPGFHDADLGRRLEAMTPDAVDALPFGTIRVGADGRVARYSRREAELSGRGTVRTTVGLDFFLELAPCMNSPFVRGRIEQAATAGTLDLRLTHVGDFADRGRTVELRAVSGTGGGFWLVLRRP